MAKGIKDRGVKELEDFQRRVRRQYSLGRIKRKDASYLDAKIEELLLYIRDMNEGQQDMAPFDEGLM